MRRLETERLYIRKFEVKDAEACHELFADEDAMRWVAMFPPLLSIEETNDRIREWMQDDKHYAILKKDTGEFIGYIAVNPDSEENRKDTRELGFAMLKEHRRHGYMAEVVSTVLDELRNEGITYVWACCFEGNEASKKLIEKIGFEFQQEGCFEAKNDRKYKSYEFKLTLHK